MSVGSWTPEDPLVNQSTEAELPGEELLHLFIRLSQEEKLESMPSLLDEKIISSNHTVMRLPMALWKTALEPFDIEDINHLIRFFTRAEMLLPNWDAGAESPVVWMAKILRQRKSPLDKQQLIWIKNHSTNKFIPNGALI